VTPKTITTDLNVVGLPHTICIKGSGYLLVFHAARLFRGEVSPLTEMCVPILPVTAGAS